MTLKVNVDNFVEAETARMFLDLQSEAGGVNKFNHVREPSPVDNQLVIRLNRDTLYSFAVVDLAQGATITLPDAGPRYLSAMVVNEGHYVQDVLHSAGEHALDAEKVGSRYCVVAVRVLADAANPTDLIEANGFQDQVLIDAGSAVDFTFDEVDTASIDSTRTALLALATGLDGFERMFGRADEVEPVRHLIGTAAGWGGLPLTEASYIGALPPGSGNFEMVMKDVPVDGFWSISVYDARGFFVPNERNAYNLNNITAEHNEDGGVTVRFGEFPADVPNVLPTPEGWNFLVRLYRPRPEALDGTWQVPALVPVD